MKKQDMTTVTFRPRIHQLLCLALLSCCCLTLNAQKHSISGNVIDRETGYPLDRVNVVCRGEVQSHSNRDGYYEALAVLKDTLTFQCTGYVTRKIAVKDIKKTVKLRALWTHPNDTVVKEVKAGPILERLFQRMEKDEASASGRESRYSMTTHYTQDGSKPMSVKTKMRTTCGLSPLPIEMNNTIDGKDLDKNEELRRGLNMVYYPNKKSLMTFDFSGTLINYGGYLEEECIVKDGKVALFPPQITMVNGNTHLFAGLGPRAHDAHGWELSYVPLYEMEETKRLYAVTADLLSNGLYRLTFRWKKNKKINEDNRGVVTGYAYVDAETSRLKEFKGQVLFRYNKYVYISFVTSYGVVDGVSQLTRLSASGTDGEIVFQSIMTQIEE